MRDVLLGIALLVVFVAVAGGLHFWPPTSSESRKPLWSLRAFVAWTSKGGELPDETRRLKGDLGDLRVWEVEIPDEHETVRPWTVTAWVTVETFETGRDCVAQLQDPTRLYDLQALSNGQQPTQMFWFCESDLPPWELEVRATPRDGR